MEAMAEEMAEAAAAAAAAAGEAAAVVAMAAAAVAARFTEGGAAPKPRRVLVARIQACNHTWHSLQPLDMACNHT